MRTNHNPGLDGPQECAGCGARTLQPLGAFTLNGRMAIVCPRCARRADDSTVFAEQLHNAVAAGSTVPKVREIFKRLGLGDIPHDLAQVDRALGLPPGSTAEAVEGIKPW